MIATLQDHAYAAYAQAGEQEELPPIFTDLRDLPDPMLEENWDMESECLSGEGLRDAVVPEQSQVRSPQCRALTRSACCTRPVCRRGRRRGRADVAAPEQLLRHLALRGSAQLRPWEAVGAPMSESSAALPVPAAALAQRLE